GETAALRAETSGTGALAVDQSVRLNNLREKVRGTATQLPEAARDAALTPELRPVAEAVREVTDRPLKAVEDALPAAETDNPAARESALADAGKHLADADAKLNDLLARNARVGRDRLDRAKLAALAAEQTALARATGEPADLLTRQRGLLARLNALLAESD